MNNELKNCDIELGKNIQAVLKVYFDKEEDMQEEIDSVAKGYKYTSLDDIQNDIIDIVKKHLKIRVDIDKS